MLSETQLLPSNDGKRIFLRTWSNDNGELPQGVVHILHGMGEHCARYSPLANYLVNDGFIVFAHDHRGHGFTAPNEEELGHYGDSDAWPLLIADVLSVNRHIKSLYPDLPITILGHSMGSFIALQYLELHGDTVDAVSLSGSSLNNSILTRLLNTLSRAERIRLGKRGRSKIIDHISFGAFNRAFKPNRTAFDWLSRDTKEVDKYINDPLCGFICTTQLWYEFSNALLSMFKPKNLKKLPKNIPYYIFAGEKDPIHQPNGNHELVKALRKAGISNIRHRLFSNARHETLNETNRHETNSEFLLWLREEGLYRPVERVLQEATA